MRTQNIFDDECVRIVDQPRGVETARKELFDIAGSIAGAIGASAS